MNLLGVLDLPHPTLPYQKHIPKAQLRCAGIVELEFELKMTPSVTHIVPYMLYSISAHPTTAC